MNIASTDPFQQPTKSIPRDAFTVPLQKLFPDQSNKKTAFSSKKARFTYRQQEEIIRKLKDRFSNDYLPEINKGRFSPPSKEDRQFISHRQHHSLMEPIIKSKQSQTPYQQQQQNFKYFIPQNKQYLIEKYNKQLEEEQKHQNSRSPQLITPPQSATKKKHQIHYKGLTEANERKLNELNANYLKEIYEQMNQSNKILAEKFKKTSDYENVPDLFKFIEQNRENYQNQMKNNERKDLSSDFVSSSKNIFNAAFKSVGRDYYTQKVENKMSENPAPNQYQTLGLDNNKIKLRQQSTKNRKNPFTDRSIQERKFQSENSSPEKFLKKKQFLEDLLESDDFLKNGGKIKMNITDSFKIRKYKLDSQVKKSFINNSYQFVQDNRDRFGKQIYPISLDIKTPAPNQYDQNIYSMEYKSNKVQTKELQKQLLKIWLNVQKEQDNN